MHPRTDRRLEQPAAARSDIDGRGFFLPLTETLISPQAKAHTPFLLGVDNIIVRGILVKVLQRCGPGNMAVPG